MIQIEIKGEYIVKADLIASLNKVIEQLKSGDNQYILVSSNIGTKLEVNFKNIELEDLIAKSNTQSDYIMD